MHIYQRYQKGKAEPGALVIKFYHSGDQIRGYIRKVTEPGEDDAVFPGEEMQPDDAFRMAENKMVNGPRYPIFIELSEGLRWNPAWGELI
jgi:hypothetical protein